MLILFLQGTYWLWRWFIFNPEIRNSEATAKSWFFLSLIIAFVCAVIVCGIKGILKSLERDLGERIWKRSQTWKLVTSGLLALYVSLGAAWFLTDDYNKVVQFPGLVIASAISIFPYFIILGLIHLIFGWRRELI